MSTYCFVGGYPLRLKNVARAVAAERGLVEVKQAATYTFSYRALPKTGLVLYRDALQATHVAAYKGGTIYWRPGYKQPHEQTRWLYNAALDALNPDVFVLTPETWLLTGRGLTTATLTQEPVGISFQFPVSPKPDPDATPPWCDYFVTYQKPIPAGATQLVLEFKIDADPGVHFNHQSEATNTGCEYALSALRVVIGTERWWYTTGFTLTATPDVVKFTVPLSPEGWSDIFANAATLPNLTPSFLYTLRHADYVGIIFGGGCSYSHGVNVSYSTAKFTLLRMYCVK